MCSAKVNVWNIILGCNLILVCYTISCFYNPGLKSLPTIEEYKIVEVNKYRGDPHVRYQLVNSKMLSRRLHWRSQELSDFSWDISEWNAKLKEVGYHLQAGDEKDFSYTHFKLLKNNRVVAGDFRMPRSLEINHSQESILFVAEKRILDEPTYNVFLHDSVVSAFHFPASGYVAPRFFMDKVLNVILTKRTIEFGGSNNYSVTLDGESIYDFSAIYGMNEPVERLFVQDTVWVLEYANHVVVNGIDLNTKYGYEKSFGCLFLQGKLFYFFKKDNKYRIRFGDITLPNIYDKIEHGLCCDAASLDPKNNQFMVWFFAQNEGYYKYVEIGFYK